jgi:uncharacterized protein
MNRRRFLATGMLLGAILGLISLQPARGADQSVAAAEQTPKLKAVFQVSDGDPKKWNLALLNIKNVQEEICRNNVDIELVVFGPGIGMLKFDSELADRVVETIDRGARVFACENTMKGAKLTRDDMLPRLDYVKAGVVEILARQAQGFLYIRP